MTSNNLCDSCTNIGCEFQSGIVRTECAFYMPPHIEPDNSGNYVVMQPTVNVLDKINTEKVRDKMTKEQKDKILKALAEDRNDYARTCSERIAAENGKITGADYMLQRFLDILNTEEATKEFKELLESGYYKSQKEE